MTASSSASMYLFDQLTSLVCFEAGIGGDKIGGRQGANDRHPALGGRHVGQAPRQLQ